MRLFVVPRVAGGLEKRENYRGNLLSNSNGEGGRESTRAQSTLQLPQARRTDGKSSKERERGATPGKKLKKKGVRWDWKQGRSKEKNTKEGGGREGAKGVGKGNNH